MTYSVVWGKDLVKRNDCGVATNSSHESDLLAVDGERWGLGT